MQETRSDPRPPARRRDDQNAIASMHDVLSEWDRRAVLYCLAERDCRVAMETLASQVAGWRRGVDEPAPDADLDRVRTRLLHDHVLEMDDFGLVEYDSGADAVRLDEDVTVSVRRPWRDRQQRDQATPEA